MAAAEQSSITTKEQSAPLSAPSSTPSLSISLAPPLLSLASSLNQSLSISLSLPLLSLAASLDQSLSISLSLPLLSLAASLCKCLGMAGASGWAHPSETPEKYRVELTASACTASEASSFLVVAPRCQELRE